MNSKMITFHVPDDKELLSALGVVTLRHEHLNHILKMTIKSIVDITPEETFYALKYEGSRSLRQRINKLGKKELGESKALLKLQAILGRAEIVTEKRNKFIHGLWAKELDGDPGIMGVPGELHPLPTVEELEKLANEIAEIIQELNEARLEGFIKERFDERSKI
ncbi:MAG: hypothetical protein ACXAB4_02840 [Candidatus Hodarchaeales archaeon]|jgi:hypothetical protein